MTVNVFDKQVYKKKTTDPALGPRDPTVPATAEKSGVAAWRAGGGGRWVKESGGRDAGGGWVRGGDEGGEVGGEVVVVCGWEGGWGSEREW